MLKSDFYYNLPEELIAQEPIEPRDASRLLVMTSKRVLCGTAHSGILSSC